jgi:hypothetical protein
MKPRNDNELDLLRLAQEASPSSQEGMQFMRLTIVGGLFCPPGGTLSALGEPHHCFRNALQAVEQSDGKLRFADGIAFDGELLFRHAWCVDEYDNAIECTEGVWENMSSMAYYGIIAPSLDIARQIVRSRYMF